MPFVLMILSLLVLGPAAAFGQPSVPDPASLRVTVQDETAAALVHATATLTDANGVERQTMVDDRGIATFTALPAGTYQLQVQAEAFRPYRGQVTLRRGSNESTVRLPVALAEEVVVNQESADERRDNGFTTTLSQEEIDALSDDPDEMSEQLAQMAGPDAEIFVDGFQGARLPPKDQIQQIRFHRNSFSAEYHRAGMVRVEVITKPGGGNWRGQFNVGFRDESLNARNAFATVRGPEQQRRFRVNFQGPLAKGKTSLSIAADGNNSYDAQTIVASMPDGSVNEQIRRPVVGMNTTVRLDHALSAGNTLRAEYQRRTNDRDNLGVGNFDLLERAYETDQVTDMLRVRNTRVIGKKAFSELRVELSQTESSDTSATFAPAIRVLDAFTSGGAGRLGSRQGRELEIAQNLDFAIGRHAFRTGVLFEAGNWESTQQTNANGTYTFSSLADYQAGIAATYSRRTGDPLVSYSQVQAGWFVQDDIRLSKALSLSLGLRQEVQTHVDDSWNLAPRAAFTWTVGRTNVRGGYGLFYDWFEAANYEQTIRLDGAHQIEEVIIAPAYPNAESGSGTTLPPSIIRAATLGQPLIQQASVGFERPLNEFMRLNMDYLMLRGSSTLRSVNVNAPDEAGVRPDPTVGNISEIQSTGRSAQDRLTVGLSMRVPSRSIFGNVLYQWGKNRNVADSVLSLPSNNLDPNVDWGPAAQDIRHRLSLMVNLPLPMSVRAGFNVQASSALPYNIITGLDDNGDTVFNDRPEGTSRNSGRGAAQWNVNLRLSRSFNLGGLMGGGEGPVNLVPPPAEASAQRGPGGGGFGGGDGPGPGGPGGDGPQMVVMRNGAGASRYRLDLYVQASNLLNHTNLNAFVGNLRSPFFGTATSAAAPRRFEVGASLSF